MNFRIADTFTDNLAKLSNDEQKAVKTTVLDLAEHLPDEQLYEFNITSRFPEICNCLYNRRMASLFEYDGFK